jgi:hypothetical protein
MVSEHSVACRIETLGWNRNRKTLEKILSHLASIYILKNVCILNSLYSLLLHLQMLPFTLDDPTLENHQQRIEDHNVLEV